jgi:hypothetical protein
MAWSQPALSDPGGPATGTTSSERITLLPAEDGHFGVASIDGQTRIATGGRFDHRASGKGRGRRVALRLTLVGPEISSGKRWLAVGGEGKLSVAFTGKVTATGDARGDDELFIPLPQGAFETPVEIVNESGDDGWWTRLRVVGAIEGVAATVDASKGLDGPTLAAKLARSRADLVLTEAGVVPRWTVAFPEGGVRGALSDPAARRPDPVAPRPLTLTVGAGATSVAYPVGPLKLEGPTTVTVQLPAVLGDGTTLTLSDGTTTVPLALPTSSALATVLRARKVLATRESEGCAFCAESSLESTRNLEERMSDLLVHGDRDPMQVRELAELDAATAALESGKDPYAGRTGPQRRAFRSPIDGKLHEFGLYVPSGTGPTSTDPRPLVVGLHGLHGKPFPALRHLFGGDDPGREREWEDRHPLQPWPVFDGYVLTPSGHGDAMYRNLGEENVAQLVALIQRIYTIDPKKISITGMSMGGTGAAGIPLHRPTTYAAAAPLCGYHSWFVRNDLKGVILRPWEKSAAEERSNSLWAENGGHLPLYVVHGTKDLPQINSGILIQAYEKLGYPIVHEHPDLGHNVWQTTYEDLKGLKWLTAKTRDLHPTHIRFRTDRTRFGTSDWITIHALSRADGWGEIVADAMAVSAGGSRTVRVQTSGIDAFSLTRDPVRVGEGPLTIAIADGAKKTSIDVPAGEPVDLVRGAGGAFERGKTAAGKHDAVIGPFRDAFHEPLIFVYGTRIPDEARMHREVAEAWAKRRSNVEVTYPILSDVEFLAQKQALGNDRALFLIGDARTNAVTAQFDAASLPFRGEEHAVVSSSGQRFSGDELGYAFITPNPVRKDRYLIVVAGSDLPGLARALSLPELLGDYAVWDKTLAPARNRLVLGPGRLLAGGLFDNAWRLDPATMGR